MCFSALSDELAVATVYKVIKTAKSQAQAEAACKADGGTLADLNSLGQLNAIR